MMLEALSLELIGLYAVVFIIGVFLIGVILVLLERHVRQWFHRTFSGHGVDRQQVAREWEQIYAWSRKKDDVYWRQAILTAHRLLDQVLEQKHMHGSTMVERLRFAIHRYPALRNVWWVHRLRNRLVHESNVTLREREVIAAMRTYRRALKVLGVLS